MIPPHLKERLKACAARHGRGSYKVFAGELIDRGLTSWGAEAGPREVRLARMVETRGYSSTGELVEHLLERGLVAYEEPAADQEKLLERLRGLGYID